MILAVMSAIFAIADGRLKNSGLQRERSTGEVNGVWTRDFAISVRRSDQLRYEATDVGSWSFVGSNAPVRNEWMMKWRAH